MFHEYGSSSPQSEYAKIPDAIRADLERQVTAKVDLKAGSTIVRPHPKSRPASPTKHSPTLSPPPFHPKVKANANATLRKLSSASSLSTRSHNVSAQGHSRPGSPLRPSRVLPNGSEPSSSSKARVTARSGITPVQSSSGSQEPRQTAVPTRLKLPHSEDVIALHHALSISDFNSPTLSHFSRSAEPPFVDTGRTNTPPQPLAPIRVKSKINGFIKSTATNVGDQLSRSLSPPYATTRPIHTRSRAPSIASFSLNDSSPSGFYPITTASPAANPHRFASRRVPSPVHSYIPPTLSNEPHPAKKLSLFAKADPASVPLPPHSPPISALSFSSKSSASKTPVSLGSDQTADNQVASIVPRIRRRSSERIGFLSQAETNVQTKRDRSRSRERSPRDPARREESSDPESDGPERQLRAEAKTNRKIADLEITNRSLLAINASLETAKNRQAQEIRDLRRKLRESRLILPPRTYKAVKPALGGDDDDDGDDNDDDDDGDGDDTDVEEGGDETFQRIRGLIDSLIESGKKALETRPEDFRASLAAKVLNADELRSWRGSGQGTLMGNNFVDKRDTDEETIQGHRSPLIVATPGNDGEHASDSRSSALPPITITHS